MAISWGTRIIMLYAGFVLLIGTLIWKCTQTKFDLVSEDYYEQELVFQQKLNAKTASAALSQKPVVSITDKSLLIFFPQEFAGREISADVKLYSPSNAALDKAYVGLQAKDGRLELERSQLVAADYSLQLSWGCEGQAFYQEFPVNLRPR